jgi:CelD/BcsL family acetyltransferase involved in cellulose biosynthesis
MRDSGPTKVPLLKEKLLVMLPADEKLLTIEKPAVESRQSVPTILNEVDPLRDSRWEGFLRGHPRSSVFHTSAWLEALRRTFGYEPTAFTTSAPDADLQNGAVFCHIDSWLTGRRLVSLPFSDHCDPLVDSAGDIPVFLSAIEQSIRQEKLRYVEMRPLHSFDAATALYQSTYSYCFHQLDLRPDLDTLFHNFHKDSTQRKIRRAAREGLVYQGGRSESLLDSFYRLYLLTRRRHQVPPLPRRWFRTLIDCFGEALNIRTASKAGHPVAGILTLRYKGTLVYKYGCSDAQFNNLGGMHLLFWRSIQEAKQEGLTFFDLGRSECENTGLITFKDRWGAIRSTLTYSRYVASRNAPDAYTPPGADWKLRFVKRVCAHAPDGLLSAAGNLLYKHIG